MAPPGFCANFFEVFLTFPEKVWYNKAMDNISSDGGISSCADRNAGRVLAEKGRAMYQVGDLIVYGRTGVCRVERIEENKNGIFYALMPLYQSCSILTPVEGKVFMRPVISRGEAEELINALPGLEAEPCEGKAVRELTEHYQASIDSHDCREWALMTKSIYTKRRAAEREKRKFGAVDERFMKEGEALLFGELAAVLELPLERVKGYIDDRLSGRAAAGVSG